MCYKTWCYIKDWGYKWSYGACTSSPCTDNFGSTTECTSGSYQCITDMVLGSVMTGGGCDPCNTYYFTIDWNFWKPYILNWAQRNPGVTIIDPTTGQPVAGNVNITSTPSNARIWIDGIDRGINTPNTISNLNAGSHTYKLTLTGYADATGTFSITSGQTTTINITFAGSLSISSTPSNARIWIDGTDQGINTPATITGLSSGSHTYRLVLTGYQDETGPFTITSGQTTTITPTLTPLPGNLSITSTPSNARIWIDGIDRGINTPNTITGLSLGNHTYQLKLAGYYDNPSPPGTFNIYSGQTTTIPTVTMVLIVGAISLSSTPSGAQIWLAPTGSPLVNQGVTTPAIIGNLTPGVQYTYELRLIGYSLKSWTFTLVDGETITRSETLLLAQITSTNMTLDRDTCLGMCTIIATITWNNPGPSASFEPAIIVNGVRTGSGSTIILNTNQSHQQPFSIPLGIGNYTICPDPN